MDGLKDFIKEYGITLIVGMIITVLLTDKMEAVRGYTAVGGELFIAPGLCMIQYILTEIYEEWKRITDTDETEVENEKYKYDTYGG